MSVIDVLKDLESAGLLRLVSTEPEIEYIFRHALLQDSAYGLLLKRQRRALHHQVGLVIEQSFPEQTEEMAPLLANHFLNSDHRTKALHYLRLAGKNAREQYANAEALEYFTKAIDLASELDKQIELANLHRERGLTHEIVGNFKAAEGDFKVCLHIGRDQAHRQFQWSALLDLGKLWAAKDYELTGTYFNDALALAREIDDPTVVARSLNRLGNWLINVGNPDQAKRNHQEALGIFENLDDRQGVAETLDFLGMSAMISSDIEAGAEYYQRAIEILRSIDDKQRLASSLTTLGLPFNSIFADVVVGAELSPQEALENYQESVELANELGWKAGESYARWAKAFLFNTLGQLDKAQESGIAGLELAREINHIQWMAAAHCSLARTFLGKFDLSLALDHADKARHYALESGSRHWIGIAIGIGGMVHLAADQLEEAEKVLSTSPGDEVGMELLGDRIYQMVRNELQLKSGEFQQALELVTKLIESAPNYRDGVVISRLFRNRGLALMGLNDYPAARQQLELSLRHCQDEGRLLLLWKLHGDLAQLEAEQGRLQAAEDRLAKGRAVVDQIALNLANQEEQARFQQQAYQHLSRKVQTVSQ